VIRLHAYDEGVDLAIRKDGVRSPAKWDEWQMILTRELHCFFDVFLRDLGQFLMSQNTGFLSGSSGTPFQHTLTGIVSQQAGLMQFIQGVLSGTKYTSKKVTNG
jgi:hypothetical protein